MRARDLLRLAPLLAPLAVTSCTEYDLSKTVDGTNDTSPGDDYDTGGIIRVDACTDPADPGPGSVKPNVECEVDLSTGSFSPVVEWSWGTTPFCGPPAVGQIVDSNGSGAIDSEDMPVILLYQGGDVVALYGDGSGVAWGATGNYGQDGGFAIGDVNADGWPDVVTASTDTVCALDGRNGRELWCSGGLGDCMDDYGYNYPAMADMNGDGVVEVTIGNAILNGPDGTRVGKGSRGWGAAPYGIGAYGTYGSIAIPIDLDGDGLLELVTGNTAYRRDGTVKASNSGLDGLVAIADFDGDGQGEIVKTSGNYVTGMETDMSEVWGPIDFALGSYTSLGTPAIDDLDGDGTPEIVFAARNQLIAMEWGGREMWRASISDASGAAGPTLFDFEMDGYPEVLYADEQTVRFFSGLDGSVKYSSAEHGSYTILETPIVADVDNDGEVEIVLGHCNWSQAITIYGDLDHSWPPGRKTWNQHGYYITNIDDQGQVPSPTESNYALYNSFRSGDVGRPPSEFWDLQAEILDVCEDECEDGRLYVAARAQNAGNIEAPAGVPLSLRAGPGGRILDMQRTTSAMAPGSTSEMILFEVDSSLMAGTEPVITADEDASGNGAIYECEERNNATSWGSAVCE